MKTFLIIALTVIGLNCFSQEKEYWVVISRDSTLNIEQTTDTAKVNLLFVQHLNFKSFSIVDVMDSTGVFHAENLTTWVYCEENTVTKWRSRRHRWVRQMRGDNFVGVQTQAKQELYRRYLKSEK